MVSVALSGVSGVSGTQGGDWGPLEALRLRPNQSHPEAPEGPQMLSEALRPNQRHSEALRCYLGQSHLIQVEALLRVRLVPDALVPLSGRRCRRCAMRHTPSSVCLDA